MHWKWSQSLLLVLLVVLGTMEFSVDGTVEAPPKCLKNLEGPQQKFAHYMGHGTKVIIESSERELHRITSEIFRIFAMEVLGFAGVDVNVVIDDFNVEKIVDRLSPAPRENVIFPLAMVNLEVWVPSNYDLVYLEDTQLIKEYGYVAPPGRFGWFIPADMGNPAKKFYEKNWSKDYQEVHWSFLRDRNVMSMFSIDGAAYDIVKKNLFIVPNNTVKWCEAKACKNGIYTPPQCEGSQPCALLLTSSYNSTKYVIDHINQMALYTRVAFLDRNLDATVKSLRALYRTHPRKDKSLLVLHYTPSVLILRPREWISVAFQQCDMLNSTYSIGCHYELNRLVKLSWNKFDSLGLQAAVRNFKFNEIDYDHLLDIYEQNSDRMTFRGIACEWMKTREESWSLWKTEPETNKIYIGGIFPLGGSGPSGYNGAGIVRGALLATEAINNNNSILANHRINLVVSNGRCRPDNVMKSFIDYIVDGYYNNLIGVLGPACSDTVEPLAGVSKHYHIMVISYSAEGTSFSDRVKYPYFFRTIGENNHYKHVYLALFKQMGWNRVAALTEDGQRYTEYISHMQQMLEENGITFIANTKFPRDRDTLQMARYLEDLKRKTARIIILDVFDEIARSVMCEAHHMKMRPRDGYVWFLPSWLNETWYNTDYFNANRNETVNCTSAEMVEAVKGYFSMAHAYFAPDDTVIQGNMTVAEWKVKFRNISHFKFDPGMSNYAGYAYDAIWTYALALDALIKDDPEAAYDLHSEGTTNKLVELIKETDFYGVSGRIKFRGGPSRFSLMHLMEFYDNQTHTVAVFYPNLTDDRPEILGGELVLNQSAIRWFTPNQQRPHDGAVPPPSCALDSLSKFLNVTCEMAIVILNMIGAGVLLVVVVTAVYMLKRRYDKKVKYTEKYMRHFGIDLALNPSAISDLDKWEIPRNAVVINRKLGEGAFGTVYGGEAEFAERGWVGVAVKTLKVGSSTEEKLDFLSEAEVMKRFDHKNIVQLLGVCTKEEPIYTIMEYMLYGDLKTYLLARRHLVNDKSIEESEEISSKKLTQMALDVARGLSYLAQLKYVHRDVASRNCLINSERVVKLGDFGMTRPMYENDYYRFTRKGMLPVRWMSPESLALGVFSPASDVWSYGILLYEIITFGSFPYQGMNNNQVLDYVKEGHTLTIPQGVKPQLKGLLKSCWNQDTKLRTRASEIVEFLANNPRLIVPCLDVPLASVQLEDTNQLEITLPDQFRKCSSSNLMKTSPPPSTTAMANGIAHAQSLENLSQDNGIGMTTDCCPKEPLLGRSSSSIFNKFVIHGPANNDETQRVTNHIDEEDYLKHNPSNNGYVISKV